MATETLKLQITADNAQAVAELNQLSQELKKLESGIAKATDAKSLVKLSNELGLVKARMEVVNASLSPIVPKMQEMAKSSNTAAFALTNVGRVAQDLPFGFIGIQNNLNPLLESFQRLKAETGTTGGALKALGGSLMGAGGIGLALSVASSAFLLFGDRLFDSGKKAQEAKKEIDDATKSIAKDAAQIAVLAEKYRDTNLSLGQRREIIKQLNNISPEYFKGLKAEATNYVDLKRATDAYTQSLAGQIRAKIKSIELEKVLTEQLKLQEEQNKVIQTQQDFAIKNRTGREATGSPVLAKNIALLEKQAKLIEKQIADTTKIQDLEEKGARESTRTEAIKPINVKVEYRSQEELAVNDALKDRLEIIKQIANELQRQQLNQQKKDFLIAGGVQPQKTQALQEYDQNQIAAQQMILGLEQSRISALDEINKKYETQMQLGEAIANTFVNVLANVATAENPFEALGNAVKRLVVDLAAAAAKMLLIRAIMMAINPAAGAAKGIGGIIGAAIGGVTPFATGGVVTGPTMGLVGEAGPEAIIPLDRLNGFVDRAVRMSSMNLNNGMASQAGDGGEFVLRGNDLVLAMQRAGYSLNLRR